MVSGSVTVVVAVTVVSGSLALDTATDSAEACSALSPVSALRPLSGDSSGAGLGLVMGPGLKPPSADGSAASLLASISALGAAALSVARSTEGVATLSASLSALCTASRDAVGLCTVGTNASIGEATDDRALSASVEVAVDHNNDDKSSRCAELSAEGVAEPGVVCTL